jgi:autonomous glycyl radical cofactor GrcA
MYADTYLKLTDGILDKIDDSDQDELIPAQLLLDRFNNHNKYVVIDAQIINDEELWTEKLGNMSENEITEEILNISAMGMSDFEGDALVADDIIVKKSQIHHGMKGDNRKWNCNELLFPT